MFLLFFFCTLSISNNKFSIIYDGKRYSNPSPILINTNIENIQELCEPILKLIPDNEINFEKNLKPQNVLKSIKENNSISFLDIDGCNRFNLFKLLNNYDENSKKCKQKITGIGYYSNSKNKRHYLFGIYENDRLKSYLLKKRKDKSFFNKFFFIDLYIKNKDVNPNFNEKLLKNFFEYTVEYFNKRDALEIDLSYIEFDIGNFIKNTEIESLRSVKTYANLLFSCIIFHGIFESFFTNNNIYLSQKTVDNAIHLCEYIQSILLKSQKSFGSNATIHKNTIIRRLVPCKF